MTRYRRKNAVVEAVQWTGNHDSLREISDLGSVMECENGVDLEVGTLLDGVAICNIGDWVLRNEDSTLQVVKKEEFSARYEQVESEDKESRLSNSLLRLREAAQNIVDYLGAAIPYQWPDKSDLIDDLVEALREFEQ